MKNTPETGGVFSNQSFNLGVRTFFRLVLRHDGAIHTLDADLAFGHLPDFELLVQAFSAGRETLGCHRRVDFLQGAEVVKHETLADLQAVQCNGEWATLALTSDGYNWNFDIVDDFKHGDFLSVVLSDLPTGV